MAFPSAIHDPLAINLRGQTRVLLSSLPPDSPHAPTLRNATSGAEITAMLSGLLASPDLTIQIATIFRPILLDLSARWLDEPQNTEDQLVALCLLLEVHEEIFPVLHNMLLRPEFVDGPIAFVAATESPLSLDVPRLQRLLLAYYRILQAHRELPRHLLWSISPLSVLIWTPGMDSGVRFLAIRCYSLQSGMGEAEREKLERATLGDVCGVDCPLDFGRNLDGSRKEMDGWIMPVFEVKRVQDMRNAIVENPQTFYDWDAEDKVEPYALSPRLANVQGILLLGSPGSPTMTSPLISTPTTDQALRSLALHVSLRLPTLLSSPPSSGKSLLLSHLSELLHPGANNQIIHIHLADTSLDPRSLLGSYVSSPTQPGTFEWKEGVLVRSMRQGRWVVFEDIDRGSSEVLGVIKPLVESLGLGKWIGQRASLEIPSRGRVVAADGFAIFATRSVIPSRTGAFPAPLFFGAHKFHEIHISSPTHEELNTITASRFPRLAGSTAQALVRLWDAVRALGSAASTRNVGLRELEKFCTRIERLLPRSHDAMDVDGDSTTVVSLSSIFPNPMLREDMYLEARDVFFGAGTLTASARAHADNVALVIAQHLGLEAERSAWVLNGRTPEFDIEKDVNARTLAIRVGRTRLAARSTKAEISAPVIRPFAMHRPAVLLLSRIATAVSIAEPVLLTGETGTGKTSVVTHLASLLRRPLVSLNLSHQTESADLVGGFKPIDARIPGSALHERFLELFGGTFSRRKNEKFEAEVRKAAGEGKWKRAVGLWKESTRLAKERIQAKGNGDPKEDPSANADTPRKRRKMDHTLNVSEASWAAFERDVSEFEVQHVQAKGKFAFGFVEGPLVKALRSGDWVLLDEINLASPETLECISGLLRNPGASITLTEQGSLEPVPRHPDFRLFACMNPATDVGKKDLPPNIRSRFTEIDVPPPDADRDTLLSIITQYIGDNAVGDKAAIMNMAEFYAAVKQLAEMRQIADGSNHKPHYSMRTLARALTFAADIASAYSLRRAIWEGCLMAFTMVLDAPSAEVVTALAQKHLLAGVRNPRSLLMKEPSVPHGFPDEFVKFGPFYLEKGPLPVDLVEDYIMTPSVETKLIDLARIVLTRRFPVLIEGPTSSGKTSSVEYLAKRTGHRFIRINNHEHTDIQEYLGSYVSDPATGKLVFKDGLLVRALRNGDWIVLDELNLAPTDVLEALNRLLDDNRELVIPETQEVVRPNSHFMLFATQNPPGLYAGRKVLSRAFRNRFLEVHFDDVPQAELETILCQRCRIAPSYGMKIVRVFRELQKRRQAGRVFETKQGFATLRDLFRWAGRDAIGYQELAENGYMLLAERARRDDDKAAVKDVIESVMGVKIDDNAIYNLHNVDVDFAGYLDCPIPTSSSNLIWTRAMQRLFILVGRALRFNEPVLLVGETGSGKTSVCQIFADACSKQLHGLNCHQNTETADLIGGLRPVRNRSVREAEVYRQGIEVLQHLELTPATPSLESLGHCVQNALASSALDPEARSRLDDVRRKLLRLKSIFEWHDGPLVDAMRSGDVFLLDEISLADDSVLERLNSVLEPARTLVLAERGGDDLKHPAIRAVDSFKLVATMNPGGDYGKKELSPALRNRFTEIWVPPVDDRNDLELIVDRMWKFETLRPYTLKLLDFAEWLSTKVGDRSLMSLRDILAWVVFSNSVYSSETEQGTSTDEIFHHAAQMTFLDGLGSLPQLAAYSREAIRRLKDEAVARLQTIAPLSNDGARVPNYDPAVWVQLGTFAIVRGPEKPLLQYFNLRAPTAQDNAMRVVRACQVPKPILLEGSPGVGKTSLITALANIAGHRLCRINLSDQTDLIDLFGSDLPVEGGGPGEFAWKDAEFLTALQEGHWVLLDEMNLAPQAVLEGLNAVLDHRGTVYIPELGRSFTRHPGFRIFAAQNPLNQGGGRKGLPKSFVNRFTKVYIEELSPSDLLLVCQHLFPAIGTEVLQAMISFNTTLNDEVSVKRSFARAGSPWEFNLRDVLRWATLLDSLPSPAHPSEILRSVYLDRFREVGDARRARLLFDRIFQISSDHPEQTPCWAISAGHLQVGRFNALRQNNATLDRPGRILKMQLPALETIGHCVSQSWLAIITGPRNSGKTELVRSLANCSGRATDTMDILGSFEQVDARGHVFAVVDDVLLLADSYLRSTSGPHLLQNYERLCKARHVASMSDNLLSVLRAASSLILDLLAPDERLSTTLRTLQVRVEHLLTQREGPGRFEWVDGPLIRAMKQGNWLMLDGANLCNPSVLDRLNSLCEPNGFLTLSERGYVDGQVQIIKPHPHFRLFMVVDPQYGELSRAMRNRGIEIAIPTAPIADDSIILQDHLRLPTHLPAAADVKFVGPSFDAMRRGLFFDSTVLNNASSFGRTLDQDSASSILLDQAHMLIACPSVMFPAFSHFLARTVAPPFALHLQRFASQTGSILDHVSTILRAAPGQKLGTAVSHLWDMYAQAWGLSLDFVSAQDLLLRAMDLSVFLCLHTDNSQITISDVKRSGELHSNARALREIDVVLENTRVLGLATLESLDGEGNLSVASCPTKASDSYAQHLRTATGNTHFDYSAVQAISSWLTESLEGCPSDFMLLADHVKTLRRTVALSTGLGISEIWASFMTDKISDFSPAMRQLDHLACRVGDAAGSQGLRRQVFDLISLNSLSAAGSDQEVATLNKLHQDLQRRLENNASPPVEGDARFYPCFLIPELAILACREMTSDSQIVRIIDELIQLVCRHTTSSLLHLVMYQRLIWSLKADKAIHPIVLRLQMQWLNDVWTATDDDGPAMLFRPTQLNLTIASCDWRGSPLSSLGSFEKNLQRRVQLAYLQCEHNTPRIDQLAEVLQQSILLIASCFASSFDCGFPAPADTKLDIRTSLSQTLAFIERTNHQPFSHAVHNLIRPALQRFTIANLGSCWIAIGRTIFDLFVPDVPNCAIGFWQQQEKHSTTGNSENVVLAEVLDHLREAPALPLRQDVSLTQYQTHIIAPSKVDALLSTLRHSDESALLREHVLQQSMAGFSQRLDSLATLYLRMGLRLVASSFISVSQISSSLVAFPSVQGSTSLLAHSEHLLLNLSAVTLETHAGIPIGRQIELLQITYGQALRLWLIDRAREGETEATSQSLYPEMEEQEFLLLFPSFEDVLVPETEKQLDVKSSQAGRIQSVEMQQLVELHQALFVPQDDTTPNGPTIFHQMRKDSLESVLLDSFSSLLPFQLMQTAPIHRDDSYNFYTDANIIEVKKATAVIAALKTRLQILVQEWPDQMVLQHLVGRSVAKLLVQTEDWEIYANRHNTLKDHQLALELACWRVLLQDGIAEWWFRLYDATIRGPLDASEREQQDPTQTLSDYLTTLIPLLDDFIRSSPIGHFEAYCVHLAGTKTGFTRDTLKRVRLILHATRSYYGLLSDQRNALEKQLRGFIKLASWKDINVQVLKASAQRTHHQLHKIIRKFRDVLRQPVSGHLHPQSAGDPECQRLQINQPLDTWSLHPAPSFPPHDSAVSHSSHLLTLHLTFNKFGDLVHTRICPFISSRSAHIVDHLAVDVIVTAKELAAIAIPSAPAEKREKLQKALMVRKRKAWSDLLKELKRAGFTVNVKADVLRRQSDARWIKEQPIMECSEAMSATVSKSENYFHRLNGSLPTLRSSLSDHHPDLVTRDLQKGVMFVESVFAMAVDSRSRLADALASYSKLQRLSKRFNSLSASPKIAFYGRALANQVSNLHAILCKLTNALKETNQGLETFNALQPNPRIPDLFLEQVRALEHSTDALRVQLSVICGHVDSSTLPILLEDEHVVVAEAIGHFAKTIAILQLWAEHHHRLRHLFAPVKAWLESQATVTLSSDVETVPAAEDTDAVIDLLLVHLQSMLPACIDSAADAEGEEDAERDRYIEEDYQTVRDFTRLLKLNQTVDCLENTLLQLATQGREISTKLQRFMPFLDVEWTKALFKLDFTIAKDGFCKPPDDDEAGAGRDASEATGGMGLGAGAEESQVEGLKGDEDEEQEPPDNKGDGDAIEMSEDIGGSLEDVPEDDDEADPEEHLGDLDASDPSAVDEKLWGDEQGPQDSAEKDEKTNQDHSEEKMGDSEVVAKEGEQQPQSKEKEKKDGAEAAAEQEQDLPSNPEDEAMPEGEEDQEDRPDASGAPMDDYVQDANTLDLPDDMDLGLGEDMPDEMQMDEDPEDSPMDDAELAPEESSNDQQHPNESPADDALEPLEGQETKPPVQSAEAGEDSAHAVAQPDVDPNNQKNDEAGESAATGQAGSSAGVAGQDIAAEEQVEDDDGDPLTEPPAQASESQVAGTSADGPQEGQAQSQSNSQLSSNPLRSLGDALQEIRQRFDEILEANHSDVPREQSLANAEDAPQAEYLLPDDADHDMQALGPAGDEQVAKLNELTLIDVDQEDGDKPAPMDVDGVAEVEQHQQLSEIQEGPTSEAREDVEGAVVHNAPPGSERPRVPNDPSDPKADVDMEDEDNAVELELREWQANGMPEDGAERIWRLYESLTHDLAYALCEQLRLILEPTLATRLKGDYRTGKRLNMKKIISYIASDYTKDKIWLRRTRPSQREYQVLLALDDSRSMAESRSVHLAFETLALVGRALGRLEAGDVAIAKFGARVDLLHGAFRFDQPATDVLALVDTSLRVLEAARERRTGGSASAADLWQLEIIISDGMCQDHERLRTVLRRAEEQRVMIVFIIVDSLHSAVAGPTGRKPVVQGSILTMDKAEYKNVDGRMELQLQRYLDSFPFEYYVVLRDVEALPEVLAGTLRQFFERISEE
ncbi:hypothetical protein B0H10DRAFT_2171534 [Mycena sp. CBHHK59/15]|nr:hypothetical protein B0H10DRAFT_2171534 [Mycena sp. CBHHK59/15]